MSESSLALPGSGIITQGQSIIDRSLARAGRSGMSGFQKTNTERTP
ncbi:MAG TPA: hypothetical protein VJI75_04710 [Candidatus Nanoarchaeia archaeon]|nr:hypothetical protein [Candidatus Nanoarchaeia archaeon]